MESYESSSLLKFIIKKLVSVAAAAAKSLSNTAEDSSPPGSSVPGILQARTPLGVTNCHWNLDTKNIYNLNYIEKFSRNYALTSQILERF